MPDQQVPQIVSALLLAYVAISVINALLSFVLWRKMKVALFRQLGFFWISIILAGLVQSAVQEGELAIALAMGTAVPCYYLNIWLICEIANKKIHLRAMIVAALIGYLTIVPLELLGFSFAVYTFPLSAVLAASVLYYAVQILRDSQSTFTLKALAWINVLISIHLIDYPFLRMNMAFAPIGFTLSILFWIAFSILVPISIIDSIGRATVRTRDEFISMASHELKTPLTSLKLSIAGFKRGGEDRMFFADVSEKQVNHMARLVENLLSVSSIRMRGFKVVPEEVCLNELVDEVVGRLRGFPNPEQKISVLCHGEQRIIGKWDRQKIEQVLMNLLTNAVKYGNGKPIEVEVGQSGSQVQLIIRDQGIGISAECQTRIFEPYQRASNVGNVGGLGLGLYIAKQIIEAHGGAIHLKSELSLGSSFRVTLPYETSKMS